MAKEENKLELIGRIDRNIAQYPTAVENTFGSDTNLVLSILSYVVVNHKNNLFNSITFSLNDFCKKYGYYKNNLYETHPIFKGMTDEELRSKVKRGDKVQTRPFYDVVTGRLWKSEIEHVLYKMASTNVVFNLNEHPNAKNLGLDSKNSNIRTLQLIRGVKIINVKSRSGKEEFKYEVILGNEIFLNTLRHYISYKEDTFIELGRQRNGLGRRNLFFYFLTQHTRCILSSKDNIPLNKITPNYNMLCRLANINSKQIRNNKQSLIKLLDLIGKQENLNFSHNLKEIDLDSNEFLNTKSFTVVFNSLKRFENKKQADFFDDCFEVMAMVFNRTHYNENEEKVKEDYENGAYSEKFQIWVCSEESLSSRLETIKSVYIKVYKKEISDAQILKAFKNLDYWADLLN